MQFKLPHWFVVILAIVGFTLAGMAQQPDFASVAGLLNGIAALFGGASTMVALHAPSIVHTANVQAVVGYNRAHPAAERAVAGERGFIPLRLLAALFIAGAIAACLFLLVSASGCTRAQAASDIGLALTDTQAACVIGEDIVAASPLAPDLVFLEGICGIATGSESLVQKVIATFFAQKAVALARVRASNGVPSDAARR